MLKVYTKYDVIPPVILRPYLRDVPITSNPILTTARIVHGSIGYEKYRHLHSRNGLEGIQYAWYERSV